MITKFLGQFDLFGSPFKFKLSTNDQHVTPIGGLISIAINVVGAIYAIYMLVCWFDGRFVPSIQDSQVQIIDKQSFSYSYNPLRVQVQNLNQTANQLQFTGSQDKFPFVTGTQLNRNTTLMSNLTSVSNCNTTDYLMCLMGNGSSNSSENNFMTGSLNIAQSQNNGSQSLTMIVYPCMDNCSNASVFRIKFDIFTEDYDISSNQFRSMQKSFAFLSTSAQILNIQFIVRLQKIFISDGGIIQKQQEYAIISDVQVIPIILTNLSRSDFGIVRAFIFMDNVYDEKRIVGVSFTQVLAQVGSVFSILYMVQYVMRIFSQKQMENVLCLEILKIYFPVLQHRIIKQDFFGRVKSIDGMSEQQQRVFLEQNLPLTKNQLNVINLFRQIRTLQSAVAKILPNHQLINIINCGDDPIVEVKDSPLYERDIKNVNKTNLLVQFNPETIKLINDIGGSQTNFDRSI